MQRFLSLLAISLISTNVGCTLCSNCDDYSYGAFGGLWERSDLTHGRVGSAFSPQGFQVPADSPQADSPDLPPPPDAEPIEPPAEGDAPRPEMDDDSLLDT